MSIRHPYANTLAVRVFTGALLFAAARAFADQIPIEEFLEKEKTLYSQAKQELIIRHFFQDRRDGFFVDVGCFHWEQSSTTCYLERHLGWSGIAIDAQDKFAEGWKKHRPRSKFFAVAVTDKSGETITFYQTGTDSKRNGGTSSTELTNINKLKKRTAIDVREITVPTITLNDLLDREGVKEMDFLSMDINGAEPIALKGFDIQRFRPELVHVEASPHRQEELAAYFKANNYKRIDEYLEHDRINWYFTPDDRTPKTASPPSGE